jgi:endonuclease YncB( thermonuclease family)
MRTIIALILLAALPMHAFAHAGGLDKKGCHNDSKAGEHHCHPERLLKEQLATCELKSPPKALDEGVFFGPFVRVVDGDTFQAKVQGVVMDFRLAEADAPESDQPYGDIATEKLESLLKGQKKLVLVPIDTDRYGRTVVFAWVRSTCVNKEMIRLGAAWFYDEFSHSNALHLIEDDARDAKEGLWNLPLEKRKEPWIWRGEKR